MKRCCSTLFLTFLTAVAAVGEDHNGLYAPTFVDSEGNTRQQLLYQDFEYSRTMLDWQENVTGKPLQILEAGQEGLPFSPGVAVSGAFWFNRLSETTSKPGKFTILSRFPNERGNIKTSSSRWVTSNAAVGITARPMEWATFYFQNEFTEVEFPGQEDWQWRKYYGIIGDLNYFPVYAYYGRNTVDFGWMDAYNPFTHSVNNHFFRVDSDHPVIGLGYKKGGLHAIGTLIHSGRQLRVADSDGGEKGYDNGAFNISYQIGDDDCYFKIGGGYLHNTIYNNDVPHHPGPTFAMSRQLSPDLVQNSAYDIYAEIKRGPIRFGVERTQTSDLWPATGHKVSATTIQAAYDRDICGKPTTLSAVYGIGRQGPDGTEFEKLTQFAFGFESQITEFFALSAEYVRNEHFVPLVSIRTVSDADVTSDAFLVGGKLSF